MRYGKRQKTKLNRKRDYQDLVVMFVGACILIGAVLLFGCTGDSVTSPAPLDPVAPAPVAVTPTAAQPAPEATPEPDLSDKTPWVVHPIVDGIAEIHNDTNHTLGWDVCYFKNGPHPQERLAVADPYIAPNVTMFVPIPDIKYEGCSIELQVDVAKDGKCMNRSDRVDAMAWGYPTLTKEPGEWEWTDWTLVEKGTPSECVEGKDGCSTTRVDVYKRTATRSCSEDTQEETEERTVIESCTCPVTCTDTGIWTFTNTEEARHGHTFKFYVEGSWSPFATKTLAGGEQYSFEGKLNTTIVVYVGWTKVAEATSGSCGEVGASCHNPKGSLKFECVCIDN